MLQVSKVVLLVCVLLLAALPALGAEVSPSLSATVKDYTGTTAQTQLTLQAPQLQLETGWYFQPAQEVTPLSRQQGLEGKASPDWLNLAYNPWRQATFSYSFKRNAQGEAELTGWGLETPVEGGRYLVSLRTQTKGAVQQQALTLKLPASGLVLGLQQQSGPQESTTVSAQAQLGKQGSLKLTQTTGATELFAIGLEQRLAPGTSLQAGFSGGAAESRRLALLRKQDDSQLKLELQSQGENSRTALQLAQARGAGRMTLQAERSSTQGGLFKLGYAGPADKTTNLAVSAGTEAGEAVYGLSLQRKPAGAVAFTTQLEETTIGRKRSYQVQLQPEKDFALAVKMANQEQTSGASREQLSLELTTGRLSFGLNRAEENGIRKRESYNTRLKLFEHRRWGAAFAAARYEKAQGLFTSKLELKKPSTYQLSLGWQENALQDEKQWELSLQLGGTDASAYQFRLYLVVPEEAKPITEVQYRYHTTF